LQIYVNNDQRGTHNTHTILSVTQDVSRPRFKSQELGNSKPAFKEQVTQNMTHTMAFNNDCDGSLHAKQ